MRKNNKHKKNKAVPFFGPIPLFICEGRLLGATHCLCVAEEEEEEGGYCPFQGSTFGPTTSNLSGKLVLIRRVLSERKGRWIDMIDGSARPAPFFAFVPSSYGRPFGFR